MDNYIFTYYQAIQDGSAVVGKWVRLFFEYIVRGLGDQSFFFDQKKANRAVKFIETFCHHCEGRDDLLKLELWQKAIVSVIFGIVGEDGFRQFREVVIVVARKNGKSLFAAAIIAYCVFLDGEYGAKVFCVAPKLDQADLVYSAFWQTIQKEPELAALIKRRKSDYYIESSNSSVKKLAFNAKKADGFNPHLTVCDEISSWPGDNGLKQYEVMKSALGARKQPILLSISTSGYINEGIYDELIKRCTRFLLGDSRERRLAPFLYMIDDLQRWNDINELRKSNPNLGVSVSVDYLLEEIAVAEGSLSKKAEFLTKYCNIKQNSSQAWLTAQDVEKASGPAMSLNDFRDSYCVGGIDLSRTTDLTACTAIIEKDGRLYVFAQFFLPAERIEEATIKDGMPYSAYVQRGILKPSGDNFVDYHDCFNWFKMLVEEYQIYPLKVGYDRYTAQYLVQDMRAYGFHMDDVWQGFNLTPVIRETEGLIRDGAFSIGDNDLLKVHLLDTAMKTEPESGRCKPIKMNAAAHIDGCAALLDAMTVRQKYYSEIGEQLKNE
ncbi:terminase large subunit [Bittarella massiliensis (ex Durand et al. 2017)]|uniref:terminase large subunit n=1 Tax=Bittarella massiliensis (ex Durand et al. 2017) TaxID=1720313 RepID=UPI00073E3369|nr:terminase large subunit [Bittarella massiliensis (ex Durand et al. 2017)]